MSALIDAYDVALFDLDGVLYLGPQPVPGAVAGLSAIQGRGVRTCFVTNNAARSAADVAAHLTSLGFRADEDDLVTSAQAATALMRRELPPGASVLVAGTSNLVQHMVEAGFRVVPDATAQPDAVIQGYDPEMTWRRLDEAAIAVQGGARWYACNTDSTRPTERGLVPGAGVAVHAVQVTTGRSPSVTGKPFRPLMDAALERTQAQRPLFVGDRLDTDIAGAVGVGIDCVLVFTGVHGKRDLVTAAPDARPTFIAEDLPDLARPPRTAELLPDAVRCGQAVARALDGHAVLSGVGASRREQLDALWALANLAWRTGGLDCVAALGDLNNVQ